MHKFVDWQFGQGSCSLAYLCCTRCCLEVFMHFEVFGGLAGAELVSDDLSHHVKPWREGFHKMAFSFYVVLFLCFLISFPFY